MSRVEEIMDAMSNGETKNIKPRYRMEEYLLAMVNGETEVPEPLFPTEAYLYHLCKQGVGGGGVSSWNDITDKPFGESTVMGDTLTWDGDIEGREVVDAFGNGQQLFCHVSDAIPTLSDFANGGATGQIGAGIELTANSVIPLGDGVLVESNFNFGIIPNDNMTVTIPYGEMILTLTFPKKGIYFGKTVGRGYIQFLTINGYTGFETTKIIPIEPKYLPFGGVMRVNVSHEGLDESDMSFINPTADKTYNDIFSHIESGGYAFVVTSAMGANIFVPINAFGDGMISFQVMMGPMGAIAVTVTADGVEGLLTTA